MTTYRTKRIYKSAAKDDGYRVLVDRVWPRGIKKEDAKLDEWAKDIAPSSDLRKWFDHDPKKFSEFKARYKKELKNNDAFSDCKKEWKKHDTVTILYGAKDEEHNQAVVIKDSI